MYRSVLAVWMWAALISMQSIMCIKPDDVVDVKKVNEMKQKWDEVVDESSQTNRGLERSQPPVTSIPNEESLRTVRRGRLAGDGELPFLTGTLLAWITTQTENIVEELEALAKDTAQSNKLSIKNYVRYLSLYNTLGVVARQNIDELRWVAKKYKIFGTVKESAENVIGMWLADRETEMTREEQHETVREQNHIRLNGPTKKWIRLYEDIKYIATQGSLTKELVEKATNMLNKSPGGADRQRNMRYKSLTRSFN